MAGDAVIVVGAGVAGLRCAALLREQAPELKITVLEASHCIGGRVQQDTEFVKVQAALLLFDCRLLPFIRQEHVVCSTIKEITVASDCNVQRMYCNRLYTVHAPGNCNMLISR
jgi:protoporphyrinogen oxidase